MEEQLIKIIEKILCVNNGDVELDTAIGDLPEWDSLHHIQIIATIENEFNIKFSQDDLKELEDVSDLVGLVKELTDK